MRDSSHGVDILPLREKVEYFVRNVEKFATNVGIKKTLFGPRYLPVFALVASSCPYVICWTLLDFIGSYSYE